MSSVMRFLKQTPSNTMVTVASTDYFTLADIQSAATSEDGVFSGKSILTFASHTDLTNFLGLAASGTYDSGVAVKDMGERIYVGVAGEDSEQAVFALVMLQGASIGYPAYVCLQDNTATADVTVVRGGF
jgi:hypothetical protein